MRITARPDDHASVLIITIRHDNGEVSSSSMQVFYLLERLTPQQVQRFFGWSWASDKSVRRVFRDRVISATTEDPNEENWTLTMRFPGVPNPGVMLPDGSTHT